MNSNDLIRRGDVLARREVITEEFHEHGASMSISHSVVTVDNINAIPAVQQMSAVEYERERERFVFWCSQRECGTCEWKPNCRVLRDLPPEERVAAMQKWAQEHPEEVEE